MPETTNRESARGVSLLVAGEARLFARGASLSGARGGVMVTLSKVSTVTLTVRSGSRVIWTNTATVEAGDPRLLWVTPRHTGQYSVSLRAVDRAGNSASTTGTITLRAVAVRAHGRPSH